MTAQVPEPVHVSGVQHALGSVWQLPPEAMHTPVGSGGGMFTASSVHWGVWLCVVMSWNGRKNAGYEGSAPEMSDRLIAAIQSLGCWQSGSNFPPWLPIAV